MRVTVFSILLLVAGVAPAQVVYTLDPPQARAGEVIALRVENPPSGCTPFGSPAVVRDGNAVRVAFLFDDGILPPPCLPERSTPRVHSLGTFAPGNYVVEVSMCGNVPPPLPACVVQATLGLTVRGVSGTRFKVPALSGATAAALAFLVMVLAAAAARRN